MNYDSSRLIVKINQIAEYFASKQPQEITFNDADKIDYELFLVSKEWDEKFNDNFSEKFPHIEEMWEILANWRAEEKKIDLVRNQKIIDLAKKHLIMQ